MAVTTALGQAARLAFFRGDLKPLSDTLKFALYNGATQDATTAVYSATNEVSGTGYTGGGQALTGVTLTLSSGVAILSANNPSWTSATFTAASGQLYDASDTVGPNRTIAVFDFGGAQSVSAGTFTVQFPAATSTTGLVRFQ